MGALSSPIAKLDVIGSIDASMWRDRAVKSTPQSTTAERLACFRVSRWPLLALLTSLYSVGAFGFLGVSPLSPFLLDGLSLTRFHVGLLLPAVYLGGLVFSIPAGRLADRWGVRVCLTGGLMLGGIMMLVGAAAPSFAAFLGCLVITGIGWSIVNPALGRAIFELFSVGERGLAMGIKQMGQTVGGIAAALVLPAVAEQWGWRLALGFSGAIVVFLLALAWRPMGVFPPGGSRLPEEAARPLETPSWWHHPGLLVFFGAGLGLGMQQSAFLSYLPLFATQALGLSGVGAGGLLALAQAGGATARLGLGAASDKWLAGGRTPWLVLPSALTAGSFMLFAWSPLSSPFLAPFVAFCAGAGALGWVGLYMVLSAEVGGPERAGLMTGVGVAFILAGILLGGPLFGLVLESADSYKIAWTTFALLSGVVGAALWAAGLSPLSRRR